MTTATPIRRRPGLPSICSSRRACVCARADQLLEVIGLIPDSDSFLEGERAGRCLLSTDRMLSQLYEAPKPNARFPGSPVYAPEEADDLDEDDSAYPSGENWQLDLQNRVDRMTKGHARKCGVWPDGSPCLAGAPEPDVPFDDADHAVLLRIKAADADPLANERLPALIIASRANAVTRARLDGHWPEQSPYRDSDRDFSISRRALMRPSSNSRHAPKTQIARLTLWKPSARRASGGGWSEKRRLKPR
jgi:hypothetical protein